MRFFLTNLFFYIEFCIYKQNFKYYWKSVSDLFISSILNLFSASEVISAET